MVARPDRYSYYGNCPAQIYHFLYLGTNSKSGRKPRPPLYFRGTVDNGVEERRFCKRMSDDGDHKSNGASASGEFNEGSGNSP